MEKKAILLITFLLFAAFSVFGQDKDTVIVENEEGVKDTILIDQDEWNNDESDNNGDQDSGDKWDRNWGDDTDWSFNFSDFHAKPALSLNYGFSQVNRYNFSSSFYKPNLIEGKLGYMSENSEWEGIGKYGYRYIRFGNYSTQLVNKNFTGSDWQTNMWRFGLGWEKGYDWNFGQSAIIPYHTFAFDWSRVEVKGLPDNEQVLPFFERSGFNSEQNMLIRYNKTFRFGTSFEGGIKFRTIAGITLEAGYERSIIFERHLFWKWAGSSIIEVAAQGLLDDFIENIMDASPYAVPIVNFVLKNALSYGLYELRQEKMNWPFNSAPPLGYDQFKFGVSFMF